MLLCELEDSERFGFEFFFLIYLLVYLFICLSFWYAFLLCFVRVVCVVFRFVIIFAFVIIILLIIILIIIIIIWFGFRNVFSLFERRGKGYIQRQEIVRSAGRIYTQASVEISVSLRATSTRRDVRGAAGRPQSRRCRVEFFSVLDSSPQLLTVLIPSATAV